MFAYVCLYFAHTFSYLLPLLLHCICYLNCALMPNLHVNTFITIFYGLLCSTSLPFTTCHIPYGSVETSSLIFHLCMFCVIIHLQLIGWILFCNVISSINPALSCVIIPQSPPSITPILF